MILLVDRIVKEINICLENDCYISALGMALTLPDICGKAKYPKWKKHDVGLRYKKWYDEYIGFREIPRGPHSEDFLYLSGEVVYSLRNCLLHQGTPNIDNLKEAMEQGNNILGFLKSEGYFEIRQGAKCKSTDFYKVYERWCLDNLEKPLAASTFIHHLKDNQKSLGIVYDDKCIGTNRGFHNVDVDLFLPVDVPSPWDYSSLRF